MGRSRADNGLRKIFQDNLPGFQWTPIETGATIAGVPDSEYGAPGGVSGWIEHKATDGWKIGLNEFQIGWISRRARLGGRVFVAVRRKETQLWLLHPSYIDSNTILCPAFCANKRSPGAGPPGLLLFADATYPARWPWDRIREILTDSPVSIWFY